MLGLQRNHCSHPSYISRTDIIVQCIIHRNDAGSNKYRDWIGIERNTDELEKGQFDLVVDIHLHSDVRWRRRCFPDFDNIRYCDAIISHPNGINKNGWDARLENR